MFKEYIPETKPGLYTVTHFESSYMENWVEVGYFDFGGLVELIRKATVELYDIEATYSDKTLIVGYYERSHRESYSIDNIDITEVKHICEILESDDIHLKVSYYPSELSS